MSGTAAGASGLPAAPAPLVVAVVGAAGIAQLAPAAAVAVAGRWERVGGLAGLGIRISGAVVVGVRNTALEAEECVRIARSKYLNLRPRKEGVTVSYTESGDLGSVERCRSGYGYSDLCSS